MAATRKIVDRILKSMTLARSFTAGQGLMEETFGVSAAAAAVAAPAAAAGGGEAAAPAEEKTEFDVILQAVGRQQDQRDQGCSRSDRAGLERSEGPGRSCTEGRQRRRLQRRSRNHQAEAG